jgi:hypothetical protein
MNAIRATNPEAPKARHSTAQRNALGILRPNQRALKARPAFRRFQSDTGWGSPAKVPSCRRAELREAHFKTSRPTGYRISTIRHSPLPTPPAQQWPQFAPPIPRAEGAPFNSPGQRPGYPPPKPKSAESAACIADSEEARSPTASLVRFARYLEMCFILATVSPMGERPLR